MATWKGLVNAGGTKPTVAASAAGSAIAASVAFAAGATGTAGTAQLTVTNKINNNATTLNHLDLLCILDFSFCCDRQSL
jgi:hypothetical protein